MKTYPGLETCDHCGKKVEHLLIDKDRWHFCKKCWGIYHDYAPEQNKKFMSLESGAIELNITVKVDGNYCDPDCTWNKDCYCDLFNVDLFTEVDGASGARCFMCLHGYV